MTRLALFLLGPPRIVLDEEPLHIGRRKAVALLAYVAVTGQPHSRDTLATLFWAGYDQSTARAHLRRALATLSKRLGRDWFAADYETIGLRQAPSAGSGLGQPDKLQQTPSVGSGYGQPDSLRQTPSENRHGELVEPSGQIPSAGSGQALWLDVAAFRQHVAACDAHDRPFEEAYESCRESLEAAVELYRDDFMAGFTLPDSPGFDEWQRFQTQRLRDELGGALERLAVCLSAAGESEPAIAQAHRWLALDPTHEPAHRLLMELYVAAGRRGAALRQYRICLRTLEDELGLPPSAETTALYERIRTQGPRQSGRVVTAPTPAPGARSLPAFLTARAEPMAREQEVFVARERELAQLQEHLERASAGQGQVAFVTGGPGRGKTMLLRQFAAGALGAYDDLLVVSGSCNAVSGVGDPYLPFREVLGMLTGDVEARWAAGTITGAHARRLWAAAPLVAQALLAHGPHLIDALVPGAPLLARARAAASDGDEWLTELQGWVEREQSGSSDLEQRALFTQFTNTLSSLAGRRPLLLLLDDLQWADSGSIGLLFHLGRFLADAGGRLLIVGAYRPEEVASGREGAPHPLGEVLAEFKRRFGEVWIDLAQADAMEGRRFVDAYLDSPANPLAPNRLAEGFRAALYAHTGGHPLFTVELLRALQAQGELVQDQEGAWVAGAALDWGNLPARVEGVIEARVGRLSGELRELLTVASVEGEAFTAQVVARVLDQPERWVLRALSQELGPGGQRLVRELGEVPVEGSFLSRYQFAHALFQAYLYGTLSPGERRLLHHEVATALEGLYGADTDGVVVPLAHHYYEAGKTEQAIAYALRAGDQAYHAYANDEAMLYFQRVLELLPPTGGDERGGKQRLAALSGLGRVRFRAGQLEAAERDLRAAIALGREREMPLPDLLRLYYYLGEAQWWRGNFPEMLCVGQEGLALLGNDVESVEATLMSDIIALAHWKMGNVEERHRLIRRAAEFVPELPYVEELRGVYVHFAFSLYLVKDVEGGLDWIEALEQRATRHQDLRALGSVQAYKGVGLIFQGDYQRSLLCQQKALELFERIGDEKELSSCCENLSDSCLILGELDTAEQYVARMLVGAETVSSEYLLQWAYQRSGQITLGRRSWHAARERLERAAHYQTDPLGSALAIQDLGWTFLAQGDRAAALERFKDALAVAGPEMLLQEPVVFDTVLSGIDDACQDPAEFRVFCDRVRAEYPEFESCKLSRWYLVSAEPRRDFRTLLVGFGADREPFAGLESETKMGEWQWQDPFGDGGYEMQDALIVCAANGRDLWHANLSAPRLLWSAPVLSPVEGEQEAWATQTACGLAFEDRPSIGGLLLWQDQENYLCLSRGCRGPRQVSFSGCLGNTDMIIGRGRLDCEPGSPVFLRLERVGEQVDALCSADGKAWFSVGSVAFPVAGPLQVGLHAIGMIERTIYHGAYPDGTATRFESFQLWGSSRQ